jgi:hypothetical protein
MSGFGAVSDVRLTFDIFLFFVKLATFVRDFDAIRSAFFVVCQTDVTSPYRIDNAIDLILRHVVLFCACNPIGFANHFRHPRSVFVIVIFAGRRLCSKRSFFVTPLDEKS